MRKYFQTIDSPVGPLCLVADDEGLHCVTFGRSWSHFKKRFKDLDELENSVIRKAKKQLTEYFKGKRTKFDLPYILEGTPFQKRVWSSLEKIPFGKTQSYKEQAIAIKSPNAVRAVGGANGVNPICIILPCHRVIGSNGSLTGFGGGIANKKFLLELEGSVKGHSH